MIGTSKILAVMICCFVLLIGASAQAGLLAGNLLAYNDGNGPLLGAWTGTSPFASDGLQGYVDWAVFTRNNFEILTGGGGGYISPNNELVYAHQIFTTGPIVGAIGMDITLDGHPAGNGGSFSSLGITGVPAVFAYADPTIASFILNNETDALTPSEGLAYSSPNRPQLTGIATLIDGGQSAEGVSFIGIPSENAIPEPATWFMASLASILLGIIRRGRRG
jgi:hypothetical protein